MIGASLRVYAVTFFLGVSPAYQPTPVAQLPELRELELTGWDCLQKPEGAAKTEDGKERNVQKNRSAIELTGTNKADTDVGSFIGWFSKEGYHHPWRSTASEIHPVMKIEDLGTE